MCCVAVADVAVVSAEPCGRWLMGPAAGKQPARVSCGFGHAGHAASLDPPHGMRRKTCEEVFAFGTRQLLRSPGFAVQTLSL